MQDPVHMAAFAALNAVHGLVKFIDTDADLSGKQIVDVRSEAEIASGMIPGAIHIPIDQLRDRLDELDPGKPTVTVCASGRAGFLASTAVASVTFVSSFIV